MEQPLPTTPVGPAPHKTESIAKIVYVLYLASLLVGVTLLVGVVMAYVYEGDAPEWMRTHFRLQIRTFWMGLLYAVVGGLLSFAGVGVAVFVFLAVWLIVRCVKGFRFLDRREPYPDAATWLW